MFWRFGKCESTCRMRRIAKAMAEQWGGVNIGLLDDIKKESGLFGVKKTDQEIELEKELNMMFYCDKDIEKETEFIRMVMTRGQETAERTGLHCSSIICDQGKYCARCQVLSLFYKQRQSEDVPVSLKRIFTEGDAIHEKWQRLFIRSGHALPEHCDKTRYDKYYCLQFTPDIICFFEGEQMIGEIKSMNPYLYKNMLEKEGGEHKTAKIQLNMYMHLTGIHTGFTLCENKATQEFCVKIYKYDSDLIRPYIDRLEDIRYKKVRLEKEGKIIKRKCTSYNCEIAEKCCMRDVCFGIKKERL